VVRALAAERRAAAAERLAQLKAEEADRERHMREVLDNVSQAEERAREAERQAAAAEMAASSQPAPPPPPPPEHAPPPPPVQPIEPPREQPTPPPEFQQQPPPPPAQAFQQQPSPPPPAQEPASPPLPEQAHPVQEPTPQAAAGGAVSLNAATFEQLREHGLSVTQATRVLAYRERLGGYNSVDDLDDVPGFPGDFLEDFKRRVTV
jgi:hypothetical protein